MRYLTIAVFLGCLLQGPTSLAQPAGNDEPRRRPRAAGGRARAAHPRGRARPA